MKFPSHAAAPKWLFIAGFCALMGNALSSPSVAQEYSALSENIDVPTVLAAPNLQPIETLNSTSEPRDVQLPSEFSSGNAVNDKIYFRWYPARGKRSRSTPAVILLHPLGRNNQSPMHDYARALSRRGIASAVLTLPYHGARLSSGESSIGHFINPDAVKVVSALQQSVADSRTVITWMTQQPEVDSQKIGAIGISIGAIVLHLVMGQDTRVKAGVAALGGGALAESYRKSPLAQSKVLIRLFVKGTDFGKVSDESLQQLDQVDPVTFAGANQPRRVLMIEAARDMVVPPRSAEALWEALGRPPIQWLDTNHFSPISFGTASILRAAVPYLQSVWNNNPLAARDIPRVHAPILKFGVVMNLDSIATPAAQWQFYGLGTRNHSSILSANLGMSGRGPFVGLAATVTPMLDVGMARRFTGNRVRPYASLHFVY